MQALGSVRSAACDPQTDGSSGKCCVRHLLCRLCFCVIPHDLCRPSTRALHLRWAGGSSTQGLWSGRRRRGSLGLTQCERHLGKQWCALETPEFLLVLKTACGSWLLTSSAPVDKHACRSHWLHFSLGFDLLCALWRGFPAFLHLAALQ